MPTLKHFNMPVLKDTPASDVTPIDSLSNPLPLELFVTMTHYTLDCITNNWEAAALLDLHTLLAQ